VFFDVISNHYPRSPFPLKSKIKNKISKTQTQKCKKFFSFQFFRFLVFGHVFFIFGFLFFILVIGAHAYSFVVFGDNRDGNRVFKDLLTKVNREKGISFAVNTGDMVSSGKKEQYENYRKLISILRVPVYHVPGNHDLVGEGEKFFQEYFGPLYYSFDWEDSHFVILNNAFGGYFDHKQFAWLKNDLAGTKARYKFVFMHRPTFDPSELYKSHIMSGRKVTEELMRLFEKYKVNYVFAGHIHGYAKAERNGVIYVVTGGAGAPLHLPPEFGGFYHYVRVEVEGGKIKDQVVRVYE